MKDKKGGDVDGTLSFLGIDLQWSCWVFISQLPLTNFSLNGRLFDGNL